MRRTLAFAAHACLLPIYALGGAVLGLAVWRSAWRREWRR